MTVPGNIDALLLGGQRGYQIERSLRFNSADSAYLNRTPASAGNQKTWTWSGWVKRSKLGEEQCLFIKRVGSNTDFFRIVFTPDIIQVWDRDSSSTTRLQLNTNAVYRDASAWYHIVVAVDTTQATASNRGRLYVNGSEVTSFSTSTYPSQNTDLGINAAELHTIGVELANSTYLNGYLTEIHFIDGQALTPSSFGETDTITGVWKPKKYAGTYGTNGFYLKFADNSGTTSTTLGKDSSPNGNNFTPNNFSVTAGAGNDSMIDTPTPYADGGNGRGNYATYNSVYASQNNSGNVFTNGNLEWQSNGAAWRTATPTIGPLTSGKWYCEFTTNTADTYVGVIGTGVNTVTSSNTQSQAGTVLYYAGNGNKRIDDVSSAYGASYGSGDTIGIALDKDNNQVTFYKNNTSQGVINLSSSSVNLTTQPVLLAFVCYNGSTTVNFGQRAFAYTPPSGFLALNTQNLPEPSIKKPSSYMDVLTWSGTGGGSGATRSLTGLGFSPDLVWGKIRTSSSPGHILMDAVRGVGTGKYLQSNTINAEGTSGPNEALYGYLSSLDSAGFTVTNGTSTFDNWNKSGDTYVAWCWDESATPGFDIVTYTGQTGDNIPRNISHNLGVTPNFIIIKNRNWSPSGDAWFVYHSSIPSITTDVLCLSRALYLDSTGAASGNDFKDLMNNTLPTSTVFTTMSPTGISAPNRYRVNGRTDGYVAYLWSEVAGFSKFGSYTGNGSTDGPFVFTGMRSRFIMVKRTDVANNWEIWDTARSTYNVTSKYLSPNLSDAEYDFGTTDAIDVTANGFKLRASNNAVNASGGTYIFAAWAESPAKYSLAR